MLEPGGVLYIVGQILDNSRLSPLETVVGNISVLSIFEEGQAYTEQEYRDWLAEADSTGVERVVLPNKMSHIIARKPR
jgi:hypothetical protein